MALKFEAKEWFVFILVIVLLIDLVIFLNVPFLRQIIGFLFLTILPGLLIFQILKLNKLEFTEKVVLSVGLSISFLMFFGLFINNLLPSLGYATPLSTLSLLIAFNIAFIVFAIIAYRTNKDKVFSLPNLNLTTSEKAFLSVPVMFPALSIFGMYVINTTNNNIILMFLLFLIPAYVVFVGFFNQKFPKRLYPITIFLIGISLLLLLSLRTNHIIGADRHVEYYFYCTILDNLYWEVFGHSSLDACLSISLLPAIYQLISNIAPEFLSKILYSLIFSVSPLIIYLISDKYFKEPYYAFLASCFFMSQDFFLSAEHYTRATVAVLFFALSIMTLFNDRIDPVKKRILFIIFMASCIVSHYSTAYIFFFIMLGTFAGMEMLSKKYTIKKVISLTIVILFFSMIFFWYSQVTETAFNAGVRFIENTFSNLNKLFVEELRGENVQVALGKGVMQKGIPHKIDFVFSWLSLAFIGIGIITLIKRHKEMSFPELNFKKPDFLKDKFEVGYFVIALTCTGLLVAIVALPYVSVGYGISRLYGVAIIILSSFFVIGGITIAKYLNKLVINLGKVSMENASRVQSYLIILLVLIPLFFCATGITYQMFGYSRQITLNSEGEQYDMLCVHDQDSYGAKWLKNCMDKQNKIAVDYFGPNIFVSQALSRGLTDNGAFFRDKQIKGYIYLRYVNVVNGKLQERGGQWHNLTDYSDIFIEKGKIYDNGGSEVYK